MLANAIIQVAIFCALVTALSVPLGLYMARVFAGEHDVPRSRAEADRADYLSGLRNSSRRRGNLG